MESFGHKMIISSQPVPLTGTGVLYPRVRDFFFTLPLVSFSPNTMTSGDPGNCWVVELSFRVQANITICTADECSLVYLSVQEF